MQYVVDGAARMQRMIDEMMALSRFQGSRVEWSEFALADALDEARKNLEVSIAETGATVRGDDLPTVSGDAGLVARLLQNLIDNAIKNARPGVPPVVVADNGCGMGEAYLDRIFRPFYRGAGEKPPEDDGIGVGLSICRRIVRAHGGEITVDSTLGEGTTFRFTLPPEPIGGEYT